MRRHTALFGYSVWCSGSQLRHVRAGPYSQQLALQELDILRCTGPKTLRCTFVGAATKHTVRLNGDHKDKASVSSDAVCRSALPKITCNAAAGMPCSFMASHWSCWLMKLQRGAPLSPQLQPNCMLRSRHGWKKPRPGLKSILLRLRPQLTSALQQ
jgi:hypothetical protein